jgi:carboxymethylenebutenolidase
MNDIANKGFAAAVQPVVAQSTIHTDTDGLTAGTITLTIDGQAVPVYHAQPAGKDKLPVILVVSEIFGVHEHIADVARRFAKQGYLALAPELFVRQGDAHSISDIPTLFQQIDRLGITGFCWGGRVTWLYSAHNPKVKAGVAWYGRLVGDKTANQPQLPVDIAPGLKAPVLGLYGGKDHGIPLDTVEQMKAALAQGSSGSAIVVYPDADHAFHADYRPTYNLEAARDGWTRALDWFKQHGVA